MARIGELIGAGVPVLQCELMGDDQTESLTAAGSTRADALALSTSVSIVTTAGSGTGVVLPAAATQLQNEFRILNLGANTLSVYATGSDTINAVAGTTAFSIVANAGSVFRQLKNGTGWYAAAGW